MASNVAGAGKPLPQEPIPPKSGAGLEPSSAPASKPTDTVAAKETSPGKPSSPSTPLSNLKKIGRFAIIKKLGQGGMGVVFLANDTQLKRQVALKVLAKEKAENPTLVKRFKQEAQAAAQLKHDNIVAVHDAGEADGYLYIALEFIDGTDVHSIISKRGPMPVKRSLEIIKQVTLALLHAHERNIVHRDIKPSNLLVRKDGMVKLADMGLARSVDESMETNITRAGTTVGTVDYMSPEQARNSKAADARSDLYSLGATWYHMLVGHPPFHEGSMLNKLNAHASKARPDARDGNESVPESIAEMIKRLMAIKPEDRYQSPADLLADLANENLTRGPLSVKDLAALAEEDDGDHDDKRPEPKAAYKRPAPQEARQLMAATMEIPVRPAEPTLVPKRSFHLDSSPVKKLLIGAAVIGVIGFLGWITSHYGGAISTPNQTGVNPFDRGNEAASTVATATRGNASTDGAAGEDKKPTGPKSLSPDSRKSPKSLMPAAEGDSKSTTDKTVGQATPSPSGALYVPPISPLGRDGEVRYVSEWIAESGSRAAAGLSTIIVGGGPSGFEQVPTLDEAMRQLPEAGGIVQLVTDGPYFLGPMELTNRKTVVVQAANGAQPVVVLVADPDQPYDALLQLTNGALTLEGLHVVVFARQFAHSDPLTLISVRSGDLAAVRCTFTLIGTRPGGGKTVVFGAEGRVLRADPKESPCARLLTRDCLIRGQSLGAFRLDNTATDLVASRCVFATGASPVLRLTNHEPAEEAPISSKPNPADGTSSAKKTPASKGALKPSSSPAARTPASTAARSLKFLSCTVLATGTAFELAPGTNVDKPPVTEITVVNCVLSGVAAPQSSPVLLALPGWQQALLPGKGESPYPSLRWVIESSLVCGWQKLILDEPGTTSAIRNGADWKNVWHNQPTLEESQFPMIAWPQSPPSDFGNVSPRSLAVTAEVGLKGTDGQTPGCPVADFVDAAGLALARADALADRAQYSITGFEPFVINKTLQVDANTQDLGRVLLSESWPSGTLVVVSGSGTNEMTPVELKGKSLRIEFKQTGEAPLVLAPRKKEDEAMFVVEGGALEIVDGSFRFPNTSREAMPHYFLSVYDGNFALRRCQVIGQTLDGTSKFTGLIRWKRSAVESKDRTQPSERNSGLIVDSALLTSGQLCEADLRNRTLLLRNSLFASVGELFDLNVQGFDSRIGATLDARWCTFGAGGKYVFNVRGTKEAEKTTRPLNVFLENSVVLSLTDLSGAPGSPVLLSCREHVLSNQQLAWWDQVNGYAAPWSQIVRPADSPPKGPQSFDADWKPLWGAERIERPLTTNGGVRLKAKLPHRSKVSASDFTLASDCPATTWGPNQTSLGVDFARWDVSIGPSPKRGSASKSAASKSAPKKTETPQGGAKSTKSTKPNF